MKGVLLHRQPSLLLWSLLSGRGYEDARQDHRSLRSSPRSRWPSDGSEAVTGYHPAGVRPLEAVSANRLRSPLLLCGASLVAHQ